MSTRNEVTKSNNYYSTDINDKDFSSNEKSALQLPPIGRITSDRSTTRIFPEDKS